MAATTPGIYCVLILLFTFAVSNPVLDRVVDSIDKFVQYNIKNVDEVELFTLYSLKIVEGTVQHLLSERDDDTYLPRYTSLQDNIARLREQTLPKMSDEEVAGRWRLITDPWLPPKSYRVIDEEYRWKSSDQTSSVVHEKLIPTLAKCMESVTSRRRKVPSNQHRVEKKCISRDYMLTKKSGRNLQTQLMFWLYTEMYGFKEFVNGELMRMKVMGGIKEVQLEFCTNAFHDIQTSIQKGKITDMWHYADLAFYCSALGFMQFLHMDWFEQILAQQHQDGCFFPANDEYGNCDSHYSANLIPVLSMYMLLAAEPGSAAHQEHVNITGTNFIKHGVAIPAPAVKDINGPLPQLGGPPKQAKSAHVSSSGPLLTVGQLGVLCCFVLLAGTAGVIYWVKTHGAGAEDAGWKLPEKHD